jgi:hypothetical protein
VVDISILQRLIQARQIASVTMLICGSVLAYAVESIRGQTVLVSFQHDKVRDSHEIVKHW